MPSHLKEIWKSNCQLLFKVHQNDKNKVAPKYNQLCLSYYQLLRIRTFMTHLVVMWKLPAERSKDLKYEKLYKHKLHTFQQDMNLYHAMDVFTACITAQCYVKQKNASPFLHVYSYKGRVVSRNKWLYPVINNYWLGKLNQMVV